MSTKRGTIIGAVLVLVGLLVLSRGLLVAGQLHVVESVLAFASIFLGALKMDYEETARAMRTLGRIGRGFKS